MENNYQIRKAVPGDEAAIAKVHIESWQEAYKGLIPQDYLDKLPAELENRIKMWTSILANPQRWAWVAEGSQGIAGFVLFGPPRDPNREGFIELGAIYLLASEKGRGIGFSLLSAGFNKMKDLGYKKAYCWVLENNPTIKFYERSGALFSGQTKDDEIGGKKFKEMAYQWDSIDFSNCQNQSPLPVFLTERLILKGVTAADIPYYEKYFVDYEVISHLSSAVPWPYPKNGVGEFLDKFIFPDQSKTQWLWGIFEKLNPEQLIGVVHLWREGRPENRGFWLGKPFWGKGYMTEAVNPVMDYAFNELGFEKLVFANAVGNLKSRRVKEKTGAKLIDVRPAKFVNPNYMEHEIWELTKENWFKLQRPSAID